MRQKQPLRGGARVGFAAAMFAVYTLAPRVLAREGSAAFNLHLLTSDLWSALARAVLFGRARAASLRSVRYDCV